MPATRSFIHGLRHLQADERGYGTPYGQPPNQQFNPPPPPPPGAAGAGAGYGAGGVGYQSTTPNPYDDPNPRGSYYPPQDRTSYYPAQSTDHLTPGPPPMPSATPNPYDRPGAAHPDDPFATPYHETPFDLHSGTPIQRQHTPLNPIYNQVCVRTVGSVPGVDISCRSRARLVPLRTIPIRWTMVMWMRTISRYFSARELLVQAQRSPADSCLVDPMARTGRATISDTARSRSECLGDTRRSSVSSECDIMLSSWCEVTDGLSLPHSRA